MSIDTKVDVTLRVVHPDGGISEKRFNALPISIGRAADCSLRLNSSDVSRYHAVIDAGECRLFIRDQRSLNGVRLNGDVVVEAALNQGDVLSIADFVVEIASLVSPDQDTLPAEVAVRPEGTGGLLEVIRAIDLQQVFTADLPQEDLPAFLLYGGEEARESHRKLGRAYHNLLQVMDFLSSVGSYSHIRQICEQFTAVLKRVFPHVENVTLVALPQEEGAEPEILHQEGNALSLVSLGPSRTVIHRVVNEMRAVYAVDATRDPRFHAADSVKARGVRSMMCAPLVARGEVLGAVYVENLSQPYCFGHFDLNLLTIFAFHLAVALQLNRLLDERDRAFERAAQSLQAVKKDKVALLLQYSQSEKKFRALFEQSALGAALVSLSTLRIEEVNDGLVRMLGYSRRQFTAMYYPELLHGVPRHQAEKWLQHIRRNGDGATKVRLRTLTDEPIVALESCRALRLGDHEVMIAYYIDVTAKERAEQETRTQLQRVTALCELSQALMARLDVPGVLALLCQKLATVIPMDDYRVALRQPDGSLRLAMTARRSANDSAMIVEPCSVPIRKVGDYLNRVANEAVPLLHATGSGEIADISQVDPFAQGDALLLPNALYVPLAARNEVQGVVCVQSIAPGTYENSHLETLRAMAAQASLAITNARAFEAIREQEENLRQLSLQIMTAQETERGRISRELHDGVGQQLTAMKYMLESTRNAARAGREDKLLASLDEVRELATQIISDLRNISLDLRPTMLDDLGLQPTLEWFVRQYQQRYGVAVELSCDGDVGTLPPEMATAVYRIIQEGMGNAAKHADACRITVKLALQQGILQADLQDDGVGFEIKDLQDKQAVHGCSGMLNMQERAHFLGGKFTLETAPGKGTHLHFSIPVKET